MEERRNDLEFIYQKILIINQTRNKILEACQALRSQKEKMKITAITHSGEISHLLLENTANYIKALVENKISTETFEMLKKITEFATIDAQNISQIAISTNGEEEAALVKVITENDKQLHKTVTVMLSDLNDEKPEAAVIIANKQVLMLVETRTKILYACEEVRTQKAKMINEAQKRYQEIIESLVQMSTECMRAIIENNLSRQGCTIISNYINGTKNDARCIIEIINNSTVAAEDETISQFLENSRRLRDQLSAMLPELVERHQPANNL